MKNPDLNTITRDIPTPHEQIKNLKMHLSLPWKPEAKVWAHKELERLLAEYGTEIE